MTWTRVIVAIVAAIAGGGCVLLAGLRYLGNLACPHCDNMGDYPHPCGTCGKRWGDADPTG